MNRVMTNLEHSKYLKGALLSVPDIKTHLANSNAIEAAKELNRLGAMSNECYIQLLDYVLEKSGYIMSDKINR